MTGYSPMFAPLSFGDRSRLVLGQVVTSNHFSMLGIQPRARPPARCRGRRPGGAARGGDCAPDVAARVRQRPDIVGQSLTLRGQPYTIVGVAPAAFTGVVPLLEPELWLPIAHAEEVEPAGITDSVPSPTGRTRLERRGTRWMFIKGRLKPGVTAAQAHANVALIGAQLAAANPQTNKDKQDVRGADSRRAPAGAAGRRACSSIGAAGVMSVVGLVLLIACANVAGMLLARASARRREISVRLAIGASRWRLVQQLLVEGLVLGALGAVAAVACAWALIRALLSMQLPLPVNIALDLRIDGRVLTFSIVLAAVTGVLAGLLPALKASSPSLVADLRGDAPAGRVAGRRWSLRDALVVAQVALTAVLLVVAGLLLRSLGASERADVGFRTQRARRAVVRHRHGALPAREGRAVLDRGAGARAAMPGVQSAATSSPTVPFEFNFNQQDLRIDNRTYAEGADGRDHREPSPSRPATCDTLGLRVIEGRDVAPRRIGGGTPLVALVNQTMARKYWPNESAVGHTFASASTNEQYRIVGVISDHKNHGVLEQPAALVHFASAQRPTRYN